MSQTLERVSQEALSLSVNERASLAHALLHSIDAHQDNDSEKAWDKEIARRVSEIESGAAVGRPAEQVFQSIKQRYTG